MLGNAIMFAPILLEGTGTMPAYFTAGTQDDLFNHISVDTRAAAQNMTVLMSVLYMLPLFAKQHLLATLHSKSPGALACSSAVAKRAYKFLQPHLLRPWHMLTPGAHAAVSHAQSFRAG